MVKGSKEFLLFRPAELDKLYFSKRVNIVPQCDPTELNHTAPGYCWREGGAVYGHYVSTGHSMVNFTSPREDHHPGYKQAGYVRCNLEEGDALYLPSWWLHAVQSTPNQEDASIGVNFFHRPQEATNQQAKAVNKNPLQDGQSDNSEL